MSYYEVLWHPTLILTTIFYSLMVISFEASYQYFLYKISHVETTHWIAEQIGTPFFHVLLIIMFLYLSYPILYGLDEKNLPGLNELLNTSKGQNMKMINSLFIISTLLPLIPVINRFIALILPLQAIAGSAIIYSWMADTLKIEYSLFPHLEVLAIIILLSLLAELSAKIFSGILEHSINTTNLLENFQTQDIEKIIYKSMLLIFQIPILLVYTINLSN